MRTAKRWFAAWRRDRHTAFGPATAFTPAELWRRWTAFRRLRDELFDAGGVTIESPAPGEDARRPPGVVDARTVVQADGDVLWFVRTETADDAAVLRAHADRVASWYADAARTVTALGVYLRALRVTVSLVVGFAVAVSGAQGWRWWVAAVTVAVGALLQPVIHAVIGWLLRRGMGAALT